MSKLYEITAQHKALQEIEVPEDGTMDEAIKDTFEMIEGDFNDKAVAMVKVTRNMDADVSSIDDEIKRLQARKKTITNYKASLVEYLRNNMEACGISKIDCPLFNITLGKGSPILLVEDEEKVSTDWVDIKIERKLQKANILKALKSGEKIEGCSIGTAKSSILIK